MDTDREYWMAQAERAIMGPETFECEGCNDEYPVDERNGSKATGYYCNDCNDDFSFDEIGYLPDGTRFADPGGNSALRAATKNNPRNLPCPSCGEPNRLTPADRDRGYQCDRCADAAEMGF